ncbi:hypothetical protein JCM3775_003415 [Rhodotorula graminis]
MSSGATALPPPAHRLTSSSLSALRSSGSRTSVQLAPTHDALGGMLFGTDQEGRATLVGTRAAGSRRSRTTDQSLEVHLDSRGVPQEGATMPPELDDLSFLERTPSPLPSLALAALEDGRLVGDGVAGNVGSVCGEAPLGQARDEATAQDEHDGAVLLRQFTSAFSLSPEGPASTRSGRGYGARSARVLQFDERAEEGPSGSSVGGQKVSKSAGARARAPQLAPIPFATPARPTAPTRSVSIGLGLSSLHLDRPLLSPFYVASTAADAPVLPSTPTSSLAQNLVRILAHPERLPLGLFALLEACVREADASGCDDAGGGGSTFGSGSVSGLAVRAGLVPAATLASSDGCEMPPPARSMRHARSLSASTGASSRSRAASSSSLASRSSSGNAASTSTSTTSSAPSLDKSSLPTPTWTFDADQLPPLPAKCHPPNERALRFVYEYGDTPYDDSLREQAAPLPSSHDARRASLAVLPPLVASSKSPAPKGQHVVERAKRRMSRVDEERLGESVEPNSPLGGPRRRMRWSRCRTRA